MKTIEEGLTIEELTGIIRDLESRLKKKTEDLTRTRDRLNKARSTTKRLKEIINYQRQRILQLYESESTTGQERSSA